MNSIVISILYNYQLACYVWLIDSLFFNCLIKCAWSDKKMMWNGWEKWKCISFFEKEDKQTTQNLDNWIFQEVTSGKWKWTMMSIFFKMSSLKWNLLSNCQRHSTFPSTLNGLLALLLVRTTRRHPSIRKEPLLF